MIKILLCCFNEAQSLKKLLSDIEREMQLVKRDFEVMFCLDGTTDNSIAVINEFASRIKIKILPQINQRGLGIAYKRLFLEIVKNSTEKDLVITLDADNTHNPNQISEMLEHFEKNSLDVLIASRFCGNSVMDDFPFYRQMISKSTSLLLQTFFGAKRISGKNIIDYTSGYRIYRAKKIKELFGKEKNEFITEPEFTYTCEFLIKLSRLKSRLDEIAISYDYGNKIGKSKLRIMRNLWRLIVMLLKLKFRHC
jgi:dolichol-phosphate mannosyltransferase